MKKFFVGVFAFFCAVVMISCGEASKSIYVHGDETNDGETSDVDADDDKTGDVETEDVDADDTEPNSGDTRNAQCGSKPENTEWNDGGANGNFVQTFDGETWEPESVDSTFSETSGTCTFKCRAGFSWTGTECKAPHAAYCTGLPENAEWNTVSTIAQTWNGEEWVPSEAGVFNPEPSTEECRFKCKENYTWDEAEEKCQADTRVSNCTGLPDGAKWNEYSSIIQTWNGTAWKPDTKGVYNEDADPKECRYVCDTHYTWNNSVCKADTRNKECTGKPENSYWNTADEISQTWNGTAWEPSEIGSYSKEPSTDQCFFICKSGLTYDESTSTCTSPCDKCTTAEHAVESGKCIETAENEYSCECEKPYFWDGTKCKMMPECSPADVTPCRNGNDDDYLVWSKKATETMKWANAQTYCNDLTEGGFDDWRLPTISELRTLILNCPGTMPDGNCAVKDPDCLSMSSCYTEATCSCSEDLSGKYSVFEETDILWSSSIRSDSTTARWRVDFDSASPHTLNKELDYGTVRCVR